MIGTCGRSNSEGGRDDAPVPGVDTRSLGRGVSRRERFKAGILTEALVRLP